MQIEEMFAQMRLKRLQGRLSLTNPGNLILIGTFRGLI
jgi:hypothetical protein